METKLIGLGMEMFKLAMIISLPILMVGMFVGLTVSIFQATTSINEMTLSFIPKILAAVGVIIITMPWMLQTMIDYTTRIFQMIPEFIF
jgi:flagellar biosynthetic protein FliQ